MARPSGQLARSLDALTIAVASGREQRRSSLDASKTGEYEQQLQLPFRGRLYDAALYYLDHDVNWELPFLYAPAQRQVPFDTPHMTYGVTFDTPPITLVVVHAALIAWKITESNWYVGATIRLSAHAPHLTDSGTPSPGPFAPPPKDTMVGPTTQPVPAHADFAATLHLTFSGYASTPEGDEFDS